MKKLFAIGIAISSIFVFGCMSSSQKTVPPTRESYQNTSENFSLKYPSTWTFQENVRGSSLILYTPTQENDLLKENVGIVIKPLDKTYTLDEYQQVIEPEFATIMNNFGKVSDEALQLNGIDAKKCVYQGEQSAIKLKWQQVYFILNNKVYIITYTAGKDTFDQFITEVNEIISSLDIK